MPRFTDQWLYERVLFDYTTGGGASACACCRYDSANEEETSSSSPLAWFGGWRSFLEAIPDLPQTAEDFSWPQLDSVWGDRVKIRQKLLLRQRPRDEDNLAFVSWLENTRLVVPNENVNNTAEEPPLSIFIPREPFFEWIVTGFGIHTIYSHILFVVMEQVANFHLTNYAPDAENDSDDDERAWEECIRWRERAEGFLITLHPSIALRYGILQSKGTTKWLQGTSRDPAASDRRLVRLLMAQYVVEKFLYEEYTAGLKCAGLAKTGGKEL